MKWWRKCSFIHASFHYVYQWSSYTPNTFSYQLLPYHSEQASTVKIFGIEALPVSIIDEPFPKGFVVFDNWEEKVKFGVEMRL